jgi:hypothetical protein
MSADPIDDALKAELVELLQAQKFISAVKLHRARTGSGLGEAHAFITALEKECTAPGASDGFVGRVE